ncbi:hypothetical protein F0562_010754 [Nyssa sinensis]|uniref:Aminotransferase class I/classII large domain-containing protein n=1 Tax=Nyssa sinensis TaxID=561372 RepID=A0A5J5A4I8_9ASTE|nr:hypothetical protein F0562_010754 [Nyssa sinensis]
MENGLIKWGFQGNEELNTASAITVRGVREMIMGNLNEADHRPIIPLGHGDPSVFPCFRITTIAEDAIVDAIRSAEFNCYAPTVGILPARSQAIEVVLTVLARPGSNILVPRPGYPFYEARALFSHLEVRHYDLLPEKGWEVDLDGLEALADDKTVAMVIVNPGNPCGNVFTFDHLKKIVGSLKSYLNITADPATFTQGALPQILEKTTEEFFSRTINIIRGAADICYDRLKEIPCIACPHKPEGSMFVMVKLNLSLLEGIHDDMEFCMKLAKEESVVVLPGSKLAQLALKVIIFLSGTAVGLKNWLRITFAVAPSSLEDGLGRIKSFSLRHAKKK